MEVLIVYFCVCVCVCVWESERERVRVLVSLVESKCLCAYIQDLRNKIYVKTVRNGGYGNV